MFHDPHARDRGRPHPPRGLDGSGLLFAAHWLLPLVIQVPLAAASLFTGHGWLALVTFGIPLAATRVPYRCTIGATAVTLRWAFLTETIPLESIEATALGPDPRRWVLGRRAAVLTLTRRRARKIVIFGELCRLEMLRATLERAGIPDAARRHGA